MGKFKKKNKEKTEAFFERLERKKIKKQKDLKRSDDRENKYNIRSYDE